MSYLISEIIPVVKTLDIIGNTKRFEHWLKKVHPKKNKREIFKGFRFAVTCCLSTFVDALSNDSELEIETDFLFIQANGELQEINILPNSCEKIVFLKNIQSDIQKIYQAKNYEEISNALDLLKDLVLSQFETIWNKNITVSPDLKIAKEEAEKLLLIDFTHTFLMQIKNNGPVVNALTILTPEYTPEEKRNEYLEGYKYAIQFLWTELLGESAINETHLSKLNEADSWRTYSYINETSDNPFSNDYFELEEETNFDSYFYWVQREITDPLGEIHNIPIYSIDNYFQFSSLSYSKTELFGDLLDRSKLRERKKLNITQKILECLYWYPYELVDAEKTALFFGISSFNTMLAGTVALSNPKKGGFPKTIVAKFTHPKAQGKNQNDYSYAILIDTYSVAGHYSSGWVIYQNVCSDYSGFSGSEFKTTEKLISKYKKQNKIDLRELTVPLSDFVNFTNQQVLPPEKLDILQQNAKFMDVFQKSKAYLFELFTYRVCNRYYGAKYKVTIGEGQKTESGEKDVVISNNDEVIVIECKLNPNSYNMKSLVIKMENKLNDYDQPIKSVQFWFWKELSSQNIEILSHLRIANKPIEVITLSNSTVKKEFNGVSLRQLKHIMQDINSCREF